MLNISYVLALVLLVLMISVVYFESYFSSYKKINNTKIIKRKNRKYNKNIINSEIMMNNNKKQKYDVGFLFSDLENKNYDIIAAENNSLTSSEHTDYNIKLRILEDEAATITTDYVAIKKSIITAELEKKYIDVPYILVPFQTAWSTYEDSQIQFIRNNTVIKYLKNPSPYMYTYGPNINTYIVKIENSAYTDTESVLTAFDPAAIVKIPFYYEPDYSDNSVKKISNCKVFEYFSDKRYWMVSTTAEIIESFPSSTITEEIEKKNIFLKLYYYGEYAVSCMGFRLISGINNIMLVLALLYFLL